MTFETNPKGVIVGSRMWPYSRFVEHYSDDPDVPVFFYGGPFSNFVGGALKIDSVWAVGPNLTFPTVEHFFQACKTTSIKRHNAIRRARTPGEAKRMGNDRNKTRLRTGWEPVPSRETEAICYLVMLDGLRVKFSEQPFKRRLLETGDRLIAEDSPTDFIWGFRSENGRDEGLNLLGRALMQVRDELRS